MGQQLCFSRECLMGAPRQEASVTLEDFILLYPIGNGQHSTVQMVRHKNSGRVFAMKSVHKRFALSQDEVQHTRAERRILSQYSHPFLVKLHYAFQTSTHLYYVMDYAAGGDLMHLMINAKDPFPEYVCRFYISEIVCALEFLHEQNVIYRDLKPENVLLDKDGHIMLGDFGLSKIFSHREERTDTCCGTPNFIAPEVLTGTNTYSFGVDYWSLGVLMYEMLYGMLPFQADTQEETFENILRKQVTFPPNAPNGTPVSPVAQDLIINLLSKEPKLRIGVSKLTGGIRAHPFFTGINWEVVRRRALMPPEDVIGFMTRRTGHRTPPSRTDSTTSHGGGNVLSGNDDSPSYVGSRFENFTFIRPPTSSLDQNSVS